MASPTPAGSGSVLGAVDVADVYRAYLALAAMAGSMDRANLCHQLVLCEPLSVAGEAPMVAASIASAGTLCIEPDPAAVRHSIRSGAIDFTVNNLDEALRALKNELRKGLSIAVCLEGDPRQILVEMMERGVQPDLLCSAGESKADLAEFVAHGAAVVDVSKSEISLGQIETRWRVDVQPGKWLPRVDEAVASVLPVDDALRRNWLKRAPRYLGRALRTERCLPMTQQEQERAYEAVNERARAEGWDAQVSFSHGACS